jgi:hypothetical protein
MVLHDQLPEWQQKSLSRLPDLYTADGVPNSGKWDEKRQFLKKMPASSVFLQRLRT